MQATTTYSIQERSILDTLKYFHMFRHPLYIDEIHKFLKVRVSREQLTEELSSLIRKGDIFSSHNLYSVENSGQIFIKRLVGADAANEKMKEACKSAAIIAGFPFVKCVCVSGSLSKGYADEKSDIDFFIVTNEKRLWICRSILHLFKKLTFLVNKQHSFCMNYFIDETQLCLEEQNVFTSTELNTLIPLYGCGCYDKLMQSNAKWLNDIHPNAHAYRPAAPQTKNTMLLKKAAETILDLFLPERMNNFLMKLTDKLWRYKWQRKNYPMDDYDLAMKTRWYVSKQHHLNYQKRVLEFNKQVLSVG